MKQDFDFSSIIDDLGGGRLLAKNLSQFTNTVLNEKTVYSWKQQGIPDKWKPSIIKLLIKVGANIPNNFMPPGMNINNFQDNFSKNTELLNKYDNFDDSDVSKKQLQLFYEKMLYLRRFEERVGQLYGLGLIGGFCHLYIGQEAVSVGMEAAINKDDSVITGYRCHAHLISRGASPYKLLCELMGKGDGISKGKGGSMHMFDPKNNFWGGHGIVGAQVPIGTGIAFASKYLDKSSLSLIYFGDGAANQGQVYESYNMASLWRLPIIFCIENNQYGMGTSIKRASAGTDLSKHGESFGIPGYAVNGMNPISVYLAALKAVKWVRDGNGPIILEMKTYRYRGHSMSDPAKYRTREEVQKMREEQDPIEFIKKKLIDLEIYNEDKLKSIDDKIRSEISGLAEKATNSISTSEKYLYTDVLSENYDE
ncbi:MAG: Acetoin:2,6-dichlorophenolindophenol oxidoreductase subunit alpha [Alphaproteobacteria bacterium MarineAlpha9_Bin3]|nr:MAG: Acetoin:2,6-dichlorophenolindophenol oxidoreductase subunit alpha [Alphaproteobacteria bacterium MarineAlpha9_Bin3]|tara:strand:+ start:38741 stop:40009 length:1269 start_codon:yes stop_codon:yes gene_type:complete